MSSRDPSSLELLRNKLKAFQASQKPSKHSEENKSEWRYFSYGIELLSGIVVGIAIGLFLDFLFHSAPFGLIIFFLMGSLAGVLNVYRRLVSPKN